jgi:hypothetical protein
MLRIWSEERSDSERGPRLRLEGQVREPWLGELERALAAAFASGRAPSVDLAGVVFVDARGTELLRSLRSRDVELENCSPFTAEQLRS